MSYADKILLTPVNNNRQDTSAGNSDVNQCTLRELHNIIHLLLLLRHVVTEADLARKSVCHPFIFMAAMMLAFLAITSIYNAVLC